MIRVGSLFTRFWKPGERTESHVITNCKRTSSAIASRPSARATDLLSSTVARVEPSATVTTRSKAFSLVSVRFPEMRRIATRAT
jgi:hypothetical protein